MEVDTTGAMMKSTVGMLVLFSLITIVFLPGTSSKLHSFPKPMLNPVAINSEKPMEKEVAFFNEKIFPILKENCISCHGKEKQESGLRLDSREATLKGGDRGVAIEEKDPENSLLISALLFRDECELQMPPDGKLDEEVVKDFSVWIEMGTPWPKKEKK